MQRLDEPLVTPVYLKTSEDSPWPGEPGAFYLMGANGLFLCRNQPLFRSSVPARDWPAELSDHESFLSLSFPPIPRRIFEELVAFFDHLGRRHGAEGMALILWEPGAKSVRIVVPPQSARVSTAGGGAPCGIGVDYEFDAAASPGALVVGDIHSHVYAPAYASGIDRQDEVHRPGLHVVVGRLDYDPPEIHCEFVVDGSRFEIDWTQVIEGYESRRRQFPPEWVERVRIERSHGGNGKGKGMER